MVKFVFAGFSGRERSSHGDMVFLIVFHDFCGSLTRTKSICMIFWTPGQKWPEVSNELVCPSFDPSVLPSGSFLSFGSLVFCGTQHSVRRSCGVVCDSWIFWKKIFLPKKLGIWAQKRAFWIYWKFVINFIWICFITKVYIIYCILAQIQNLGKNLISEIWTKILSANQTVGF